MPDRKETSRHQALRVRLAVADLIQNRGITLDQFFEALSIDPEKVDPEILSELNGLLIAYASAHENDD